MNATESALRGLKDRIASVLGELDECCGSAQRKESHTRLTRAAMELHRCADEMQNLLMRIKTSG